MHTEEVLEVHAEVINIAILAHERDRLPVGIGALPDVPCVTGDRDVARTQGTDRLNTEEVCQQATVQRSHGTRHLPTETGEPDHAGDRCNQHRGSNSAMLTYIS